MMMMMMMMIICKYDIIIILLLFWDFKVCTHMLDGLQDTFPLNSTRELLLLTVAETLAKRVSANFRNLKNAWACSLVSYFYFFIKILVF